jgi:GNAT superfamily N-acetyltransferase
MSEVVIREAREDDVPAIRGIFQCVYGADYPYPLFFDERWLKRSVFGDDMVLLVAEDATGRVLGTASVALDVGAHADLLGELGRLAVHPDARGQGLATRLMEARLNAVQGRLHAALVENRTLHAYSQRVSESHGLAPIGFLPLKHSIGDTRESVVIYAKYFEGALDLRRNHPRVVPEAYPLAHAALSSVGLTPDIIVDEDSPSYPPSETPFTIDSLTSATLPALLRIERGRVRGREVFGPTRLHYGFFELEAKHAQYLIARHPGAAAAPGAVAGALGFIENRKAGTVRVFELITPDDEAVRPLFERLLQLADAWGAAYTDVDVSAFAPRLQRTLVELGFRAAAYVPAMVFHEVERLDVIKMVRLTVDPAPGSAQLTERAQAIQELVWRGFESERVRPAIAAALDHLGLFDGLSDEQRRRVAAACEHAHFEPGARILTQGQVTGDLFIVLEGRVEVALRAEDGGPDDVVGHAGPGESLGELSALTGDAHSASALAHRDDAAGVSVAVLSADALRSLVRQRPDIGVVAYRNLAIGLGRKLSRTNQAGRP